MCYYNLLRPSENEKNGNDNEYILCFIMADEKNNLDLYPFLFKKNLLRMILGQAEVASQF